MIITVGSTTKVAQSVAINGAILSANGTCVFDSLTTVKGIVACAAGVSADDRVRFNYVTPAF